MEDIILFIMQVTNFSRIFFTAFTWTSFTNVYKFLLMFNHHKLFLLWLVDMK